MRHGFAQGLPASLVVHPARHSDMEIERQIVLELGSASREAMRNAAAEDAAKITEDGRKITVCIALMKKDRLARRGREPVFLHQRDAHGDFTAILRDFRSVLCGGVAHCFTGGRSELEDYLALDLHIGVTGWVNDERRGQTLRESVPHIPADRLMVETDSPYLLPRDLLPRPKSRRNEPCFLPHIARAVAHLRGETPESVAESTTRNATLFFGLVKDW